MIPHGAYVLGEDCSYKKSWSFLDHEEEGGAGPFAPYWSDIKRSPAEAYDDEYRRYLKQIKCTHFLMDKLIKKLDSNPETKNSTIVIQGDHGSRLISAYPFLENIDRFSEEDYIQSFSTFFAVRSPNLTPGYVRRPMALDELLNISIFGKTPLRDDEKENFVYFSDSGSQIFKRFPLPPFANGIPVPTW
jgi:hypothetical protein